MYTLYVFPSQESSEMLSIKRGTVKTDDCLGAVARIFVLALSSFRFSLPLQLPPSLSSIQEAAMCVSFGSRICRDHIPHLLPCVITNNHPLSVMKLYIPNAHPTLSTSSCEGAGRQATGRKQAAAGAA